MPKPNQTLLPVLAMVATAIAVAIPSGARADARRFAWNYESTTAPAGTREFEQWVTWKTDRASDPLYDRLEFRHELEFGLTDRVQLGVYVTDWRYTRTSEGSDTKVVGPAAELIWNLSDPYTSALGVAAYSEVAIGAESFSLEAKLLLEKPLGVVTLVANTVLEAEWEGEDWAEDTGVFEQTLGVGWELSPSLTLGAEGVVEKEFPDWGAGEDASAWAGPSASLRLPAFWVTTAPLFQITDRDEPDLKWRTLVGFDF
ncbi:MAG TPA: hypothetical protein PK101_08685 [Thauera sp.]|nr:hypothetical protein [Thauera sp.]